MGKWRKQYILLLVLICIVGLFGCSRPRIIDKISIVHVFGFDQADNGELRGSALFPEYTKSKSSNQIKFIEERASTSSLILSKMARHTNTPVEIAKVEVLLFGKKYAESGIHDMVGRLITAPELGTNIQIAVSTNSAKETLKTFKKQKGLFLAEQIEQNMNGQYLPKTNLHLFLNQFYGEGMDAYVPMLTIDEQDTIKVDGVGIFRGDKFKLQLNPEQTILFSYIKGGRTLTSFKIALDEKGKSEIIIVQVAKSKSKWDWDQKKQQLTLNLQLKMILKSYPKRFNVEKEKEVMEMKKLIVENLEKGIGDLMATFKENEVDPLGIGNIVRSKDRTWKKESFYEQYSDLPIHVNVDVKFIHFGLEG